MDNIFYWGVAASILTTAATLPQLLKIIKQKDTDSISISMFIILVMGLLLWIYYGVLINNIILIITNSISVIFNSIILFIVAKKRVQNILINQEFKY